MAELYPLDRPSRAAARATLRAEYLARAEHSAAVAGMSHNCREATIYGAHPTDEPGCANTGVNCLCPCHDRTEGA